MQPYSSIVVTGSVAYDEIMDFPGQFLDYFHPERLHQINVSFVVKTMEKQLGGMATNIAYNASLVTNKQISLLSAIGKDGSKFTSFFRQHKINTSRLLKDSLRYTATGKVITDMKDNQIWGFYYGALEESYKLKILPEDKKSIIHLASTHAKGFLRMQTQLITKKLRYIYDPSGVLTWIDKKDLEPGIMNCTYLIGNDYEIAQIERKFGIRVNGLIERGIGVITTLGEEGVRYEDRREIIVLPAVKVKNVVDPTGAGDAFRGGFLAGLVEGKPLRDCLIQGTVLASFTIEKYGTVNHKPSVREIEKRKKQIINS